MADNLIPSVARFPVPSAASLESLKAWGAAMNTVLGQYLQRMILRLNGSLQKSGAEPMTGPLRLAQFATADLPAAADWLGAVVYVTDAAAGDEFQGSDGSTWNPLRGAM